MFPDLLGQPNGDRVADLRILRHLAVKEPCLGVPGAPQAARGSLARKLVPVWEHLKSCPFSNC